MTEYTKKVVFGGFLVLIFTVLAAFFGYLVRMIIARNLTPVEFGLVYSIFATFGLFSIFVHLGLHEALVKYLAEFKVKNELGKIKSSIIFTISFQLMTAFALAAIFWIISPWLAENYFKNTLAVNGIRLYSIAVFLAPIELLFFSIFQGYQKPFWYSAANFMKMLFIFVASAILLEFSKTIYSPILAYVLVSILPLAVYLPYFLKKMFPQFFKIKKEKFKEISKKLITFGLPVMITSVASIVISYTDTVMITAFRTLEEVAVYSAAIPTAGLLWFFGASLAIVLLPLSSEMWKKKQSHLMKEGVNLLYKYGIVLIIPFAIIMFVFPDLILRILFGAAYSGGADVLRILSVAAVFFTIGQINASILSGIGKPNVNAKISGIAAFFNLASNFILIPWIGIEGAAISTAISFGIIGILGVIQLKKHIKFKIPIFSWSKTALSGIVFLILILSIEKYIKLAFIPKITIALVMGFLAYAATIFATKNITKDEIMIIKKRIR